MNGYCGDCDKQVELVSSDIEQERIGTTVYVYLVCPWCEEKELLTEVWVDYKYPIEIHILSII